MTCRKYYIFLTSETSPVLLYVGSIFYNVSLTIKRNNVSRIYDEKWGFMLQNQVKCMTALNWWTTNMNYPFKGDKKTLLFWCHTMILFAYLIIFGYIEVFFIFFYFAPPITKPILISLLKLKILTPLMKPWVSGKHLKV